jgi:hypothetical protein
MARKIRARRPGAARDDKTLCGSIAERAREGVERPSVLKRAQQAVGVADTECAGDIEDRYASRRTGGFGGATRQRGERGEIVAGQQENGDVVERSQCGAGGAPLSRNHGSPTNTQ